MNMPSHEEVRLRDRSGRLFPGVARAVLLALLVGATGCGGGDPVDPALSRDEFVDVMVAIRRADIDTDTDSAYLLRRAAVLDSAGTTDSALVEWVERHASDFAFMAAVWDSIDAKLAARADSMR
jgi:hypothetical protein